MSHESPVQFATSTVGPVTLRGLSVEIACAVLLHLPAADACRACLTCRNDATLLAEDSVLWRLFYERDYGPPWHHRFALAAMQAELPAELRGVVEPGELARLGTPGWRQLYRLRTPLPYGAANAMGEKCFDVEPGHRVRLLRGSFDAEGRAHGYGLLIDRVVDATRALETAEGWWEAGELVGLCAVISNPRHRHMRGYRNFFNNATNDADNLPASYCATLTVGRASEGPLLSKWTSRVKLPAPFPVFHGVARITSATELQLVTYEHGKIARIALASDTHQVLAVRKRLLPPSRPLVGWRGFVAQTDLLGTTVHYGIAEQPLHYALDSIGAALAVRGDGCDRFYRRVFAGYGTLTCLEGDLLVYADWDSRQQMCGLAAFVVPRAHDPAMRLLPMAEGEARFLDYYCHRDACAHFYDREIMDVADPFGLWSRGWISTTGIYGFEGFLLERGVPAGSLVESTRQRPTRRTGIRGGGDIDGGDGDGDSDVLVCELFWDFSDCVRTLRGQVALELGGPPYDDWHSHHEEKLRLGADMKLRPRYYAALARAAAPLAYGCDLVERVYGEPRALFADYVEAIRAHRPVQLRPIPTPAAFLRAYADWLDAKPECHD